MRVPRPAATITAPQLSRSLIESCNAHRDGFWEALEGDAAGDLSGGEPVVADEKEVLIRVAVVVLISCSTASFRFRSKFF
jgi:hypothetical protein